MRGAREYADLFRTGQYGRMFIHSSSHARGKTFHIWVLPAGYITDNATFDANAVEVYGITGGQPGWTDTYGWLHHGSWERDFAALVESAQAAMAGRKAREDAARKTAEAMDRERTAALLAQYDKESDR